ncbi:MAG: hypothetical protein ACKVTZ_03325 [Bacteroidia bacterium]
MVLIFNELCLTAEVKAEESMQWIENLIRLTNELEPFAFTNEAIRIKIDNDNGAFYQTKVGEQIQAWESEGDYGDEQKLRWWSIIDAPQIEESLINQNEYLNIEKATLPELNDQTCEGLKVAHLTYPHGTLAISFPVNIFAEKNLILLVLHYDEKQKNAKVKHISQLPHLETHKEWLIQQHILLKKHKYSLETLFPRLEASLPLCDNWGKLKSEHQKTQDREKLEKIATQVALLNGWLIDKEICKLNHNRLIFKSLDDKMYLSLDYSHAAFEVCDVNGVQQGEWEFTGKKKEGKDKKDKTGKHDIKVK